ncbi:MAG: hydroxyacid dehydrogenase [Opitutaceae bacterium]|jgi:phosphoglycerate dehydrogenase-like enzyme|nr:hydroxyacid dehydrogenase [Opitutaceae bacterium]
MKNKIGVVINIELRRRLFADTDWTRLKTLGEVVATEAEKPVNAEVAAALLKGCEIAVGSWGTPGPTAEVVARCPDLKLWIHAAGTVKHFFGPHLEGRELRIASCKAAIARSVAELVLGEIILGLRRVPQDAAANRRGITSKPAGLKTLAESTVGIVSASETGRALIALLRPFGGRVLVWDPFLDETQACALGVERVAEIGELCARCDVVSLHAPALPATRHLLGAKHFCAMRDGAIFINSSRGTCIDEWALIAELERERLFAFLDVTDPEPAAADSPLRKLSNVILTSHTAGPPSVLIGRQVVEDIEATLRGGAPRHVITAEQLAVVG